VSGEPAGQEEERSPWWKGPEAVKIRVWPLAGLTRMAERRTIKLGEREARREFASRRV